MGFLLSSMLVILWLMVLCFTVGARKQYEVSYDENLDYVQPYEPEKDYYFQNSDKDSTEGYERQTYEPEDYYYPNPDKVHSTVDYPRESTANSDGHWPSSTAKHYSLYTTTHTPDGYWSSSTTKQPEEDLSRPEYIPVDESEDQPDEYEDHRHSERPSHDYEQKYPMQVGSMRGIPGITFPDYKDIPLTHFSCSDKMYVPGFYADMETGCQVFHVCWLHRRESFLCPIGTIFNQAILACDYWYSSNCSLATHYYDVNSVSLHAESDYKEEASMGSMIDSLLEAGKSESMSESSEIKSGSVSKVDLSEVLKFLPVKAKVVVYPETAESSPKIIAVASVGKDKKLRVKQVRPKTEIYEEIDPGTIPDVVSESYSKIMAEASVAKGIKPRVEQMKPKTQIYEEVEPEKIPDQPKSTAAPYKPHQKDDDAYKVSTEQPKNLHREVDPSLERIIDKVFDLVKNIVRETRGLTPVSDFHKSKRQHESKHEPKRHLPMTRLKQRFITKPVEVPKQQVHLHSGPQTKVRNLPAGKRRASDSVGQHADVSPSTKKAITESYLKRMKLGSGWM